VNPAAEEIEMLSTDFNSLILKLSKRNAIYKLVSIPLPGATKFTTLVLLASVRTRAIHRRCAASPPSENSFLKDQLFTYL
jgi:hypothetical protein